MKISEYEAAQANRKKRKQLEAARDMATEFIGSGNQMDLIEDEKTKKKMQAIVEQHKQTRDNLEYMIAELDKEFELL